MKNVLQEKGFVFISQKGSHMKFRKKVNHTLTVIVPANKKEISMGIWYSVVRQASLKREDFGI